MRSRSLARRSAAAVAVVLLAISAAGCGGDPSKAGATFHNGFLAFGYPAAWKPPSPSEDPLAGGGSRERGKNHLRSGILTS